MSEFDPPRSHHEHLRVEAVKAVLRGMVHYHPEHEIRPAMSNHYHPEVYDQDKEEPEVTGQQTLWDENYPWD
jgi:hypothetical protein